MTGSDHLAETDDLGTANLAEAAVAVVIVNYRTPELTKKCVAALSTEKRLLPKLRAIVVDGGSADGSEAELAPFVAQSEYASWVSFLPLELNGGFGWANNQAILSLAREPTPPEFVHLVNPDAEVIRGAVAALARQLQRHPRCGAAGSQLIDEHGAETASAFRFPSPGREFVDAAQSARLGRALGVTPALVSSKLACEVDWVTGASVMFRSDALRETGLFDDGFFLYFEEVELMHRLRSRGWTVRYVPESRVVHSEGSSTGIGGGRELPSYWYDSRRRYFALTGGRPAALSAHLASLAGCTVRWGKSLIGLRARHDVARAGALLRLGSRAKSDDVHPSVPSWGDPPGKPPAWMSRR
jgi:GT2 family glycosyltransferase